MSRMVGQPISVNEIKERLIDLMRLVKGKKLTSFSDLSTKIMKDTLYSKILQDKKIVVFDKKGGFWNWKGGEGDITNSLVKSMIDEKFRVLYSRKKKKSENTNEDTKGKRSYVRNSSRLYLTVFEWSGPVTNKTLYEFVNCLNRTGAKLSVVETSYPKVGLEIRSVK